MSGLLALLQEYGSDCSEDDDKIIEREVSKSMVATTTSYSSKDSSKRFDDLFASFSKDDIDSKKTSILEKQSKQTDFIGVKRKASEMKTSRKSFPTTSLVPPQLSRPNVNTEDTNAWTSRTTTT